MAKNNRTADRVQAMLNFIGGDDVLDMLMDGRAKLTVEIIRRLTVLTSVMVAINAINLHDSFKTREGLWTSSNFNKFILSGAAKRKVSGETTIGYADLVQASNNAEVGDELPEGYVFENVHTFLAQLATLIESQWGGKEGTLLNTGYANIFYVKVSGEVFAVSVHRNADLRKWLCDADRLDVGRWLAGDRAFSATAA